ncbi:flagellar basal-body rod protein FlgG [Enterococcus sp. DIV2402]|uniref:Flagellar basal-body rod protein FlgG n=1 Tax=Candidatus Enterococcus lowellii TaxID=2230877 RepID=A0ABZ2SMD8_9ENTE|nr:flagellar hook basal-body protein [Enterococcus sp. DIV2402]MBO0465740.1 flagellar hook basal-body protein [Enterococcus sp. DIV2402]
MNLNSLLHVSKSGINGLQQSLDRTANNIANVNTTGYKEKQTSFRELLTNQTTAQEVNLPVNAEVAFNRGVETAQQSVVFRQGALRSSDSPLDLAIQGEGFFGVRDANNQLLLTRDGNFGFDANGTLVNSQGLRVDTTLTVPYQQWPQGKPVIDQAGNISITANGTSTPVGRVMMYLPENPETIVLTGDNLYQVEPGTVVRNSNENIEGLGTIQQSMLENSNVELARSMTEMITTQRAYSLNTRVLQSTDEMLSIVNRFTD